MRLLVVEDDKHLADTLVDLLESAHYLVDVARDGVDGLRGARSGIYDAVVLDVMLPKMDGFEVLGRLRESGSGTPVLMLTALANVDDRVRGLNKGADYYLPKPFDNAELLAALGAIMRRPASIASATVSFGDLVVDPGSCTLSSQGRSVQLNAKELAVMELLTATPGRYVPKAEILRRVWGCDTVASANNVEAYVSFLRRKLELLGSSVSIAVQRNVGYRLELP